MTIGAGQRLFNAIFMHPCRTGISLPIVHPITQAQRAAASVRRIDAA
jgi:hypothetical protein